MRFLLLLIFTMAFFSASVNAVTWGEGVSITTENVTWVFNQTITGIGNTIIGGDYIVFESDNISLVPNSTSTINIYDIDPRESNSFDITPSLVNTTLAWDITSNNYDTKLTYNVTTYYNREPFNLLTNTTYWYYKYSNLVVVRVYDFDTNNLLNTTEVSLRVASDDYVEEYNISSGQINISLIDVDTYQFRISSDDYNTATYYLVVSDHSEQTLDYFKALLKKRPIKRIK